MLGIRRASYVSRPEDLSGTCRQLPRPPLEECRTLPTLLGNIPGNLFGTPCRCYFRILPNFSIILRIRPGKGAPTSHCHSEACVRAPLWRLRRRPSGSKRFGPRLPSTSICVGRSRHVTWLLGPAAAVIMPPRGTGADAPQWGLGLATPAEGHGRWDPDPGRSGNLCRGDRGVRRIWELKAGNCGWVSPRPSGPRPTLGVLNNSGEHPASKLTISDWARWRSAKQLPHSRTWS